jgi:hypothetical protein
MKTDKIPRTVEDYIGSHDRRLRRLELRPSSKGGGTGGGAVTSVNGKTGTVILGPADVGALPASYTPEVTFSYATAALVWDATHNLNRATVDTTIKDNVGNVCMGDISFPTANTVRVTFAVAVSGTLVVRR